LFSFGRKPANKGDNDFRKEVQGSTRVMKETLKKIFTNRFLYLALIVLVAMSALVLRLYRLQIIEGKPAASSGRVNTHSIELEAPRGNIYDCNGVLLATNRTAYEVLMVNVSGEQAERDEMYLNLIKLFEAHEDIYNNPLKRYLKSPDAWGVSIDGEDETEARANWISTVSEKKADREFLQSPAGAFRYLRDTVFKLDKKYSDEDAYKIMCLRYETYTNGLDSLRPTVIATDCCEKTMEILSARHLDFPGITTEKVYFRKYVNTECISQIIGYVRAISGEEYDELKDKGYSADDIIGKTGIEKSAEDYLRGTKGSRVVYKDKDGTVKQESYTAPVAGNDVYLTIDIELQKVSHDSLAANIKDIASRPDGKYNFGDCNAGSIVVSDVNTGNVLAMVSYPGFDNSIFVQPSADEAAQQAITDLFADKNSPGLNRATQGLYSIGSTIKPLISIAALETGKVTTKNEVRCQGVTTINGRKHTCLSSHGYLNLEYAIAKSCNIFFYDTGIKTGIDVIDDYAEMFGLGEKTGIEIAEYEGFRSNPETMELKETDKTHKWTDSDTAQTSIGQLYTSFTPLQVNRYVSAIANGGYLNTPHVIGSISSSSGGLVYSAEAERKKIDVSDWSLSVVRQGMLTMSKTNGTIKTVLKDYPEGFISAKTGTVETGDNTTSSNGVFMCYAPSDKPQIAITVVVEHGVYGGYVIPSISGTIDTYFGNAFKTRSVSSGSLHMTISSVTNIINNPPG